MKRRGRDDRAFASKQRCVVAVDRPFFRSPPAKFSCIVRIENCASKLKCSVVGCGGGFSTVDENSDSETTCKRVLFDSKYLAVRARRSRRSTGRCTIRTITFSNGDELAVALDRRADECRRDSDLLPREMPERPWWLFARRRRSVRLFDPLEMQDPYVVPVNRETVLRDDPPRDWFPTANNRRIDEFAVPRALPSAFDLARRERGPQRKRGTNRTLDEFFRLQRTTTASRLQQIALSRSREGFKRNDD